MKLSIQTIVLLCALGTLPLCAGKSKSDNTNPVAPSTNPAEQFFAGYQPSMFLAGVLISDFGGSGSARYVLEIATAFKTDGGLYYTNAHVALAMHKLAGAFISDWVERPFQTATLVLVPSGDSIEHALALDGFSLHPRYDTTLECPDIAELFLKNPPASHGGIPVASTAEVQALGVGQPIWTIGFPGETEYYDYVYPEATLKTGSISALRSLSFPFPPTEPNQLIQYDFDLTGGTSGSPVFNAAGNCIGINYAGYDQGSINFAIRSDLLFQTATARQQFADVDTYQSDYEIVPGVSIGDLSLDSAALPSLPNYSKAAGNKVFFSDSLTYVVQCLTAGDSIKAMRLYQYNYDLFDPVFWTKDNLYIGADIAQVPAAYTPSLIRVDHVDRGIDTVDISVVQAKGIAFVSDPEYNTIKEIYVFPPADSIDFSAFTYEKKFLAKTRAHGGVTYIRVPGSFMR